MTRGPSAVLDFFGTTRFRDRRQVAGVCRRGPRRLASRSPSGAANSLGPAEPGKGSDMAKPNLQQVYFIEAEDTGFIKIGIAENPVARLADLQVASPHRLTLRHTIPGGRATEQALHDRWADLRVRGEWFHLAGDLADYLDTAAADVEIRRAPLHTCLAYGCNRKLRHDEYCHRHNPAEALVNLLDDDDPRLPVLREHIRNRTMRDYLADHGGS